MKTCLYRNIKRCKVKYCSKIDPKVSAEEECQEDYDHIFEIKDEYKGYKRPCIITDIIKNIFHKNKGLKKRLLEQESKELTA